MRYAYTITGALLLGGAAATMIYQPVASAQTAQNEPGAIQATAPKAGAPMSFADMVARLQPAVVNISTKQRVTQQQQQFNPFSLFGLAPPDQGGGAPVTREAQSLGSGFIISADGYVVTNNHVISAGARGATVESITVTMPDRKEYTAKLIGRDPASDLALLKIQATGLPFVKFGDSRNARVGDWIVAIGNPFGIGSTVTAGIISALHRTTGQGGAFDRFIQTDASINQGNSGGPMFDLNGNVIGINSQILSPTGGNVGIGFAIPAEEAKPIIDQLRSGTAIKRGYLGVGIQPITDEIGTALKLPKNRGEIIARVEPNEAAARAGIRSGDVVLKVNGKDVTPDQSLSYLVANLAPGSRATLDVLRDGKPMTINATVGTRPSEESLLTGDDGSDDGAVGPDGSPGAQAGPNALGITVRTLTPQIARQLGLETGTTGVVITDIDQSSDMAQKGFQPGDVITGIRTAEGGVRITTPQTLAGAVQRAKASGAGSVVLSFQRKGIQGERLIGVRLK